MKYYTPTFEPDKYYHIYSHAVGKDILFKQNENYIYFLEKYKKYINPIIDTFAYCLLPNHFHFAVRVKNEVEIDTVMRTFPKFETLEKLNYEKFISKQFSNLLSSYTQSFNKQQNRKDNLFQKPFKRTLINNEKYIINVIHYIHYNPVHHKFTKKIKDWNYSSYNSILSSKETNLKRKEVIELFGNKKNFTEYHNKEIDDLIITNFDF